MVVCDPLADEVFFDDPGLLNKLANSPGPEVCWVCNKGTAVPWDCKPGPPRAPEVLCGTPVEGVGVMRL